MKTAIPVPKIELIFDADCPNVTQARHVLARALTQLNMHSIWQEWERSDENCPVYARHYGSPTILVNGQDVSRSSHNESACCRVYLENPESSGCPGLNEVVDAIQHAAHHD